jgi:NAD(P)-dependent dehydrogenase (short-subunit alcohol dehydrogenase family)
MEIHLDGRVALITGGSVGMGKAMAHKFASAGAEVAIVARRPEPLAETVREIRAAGERCHGYPGDVSRADEINRLFAAVTGDLGRVDILVNNAGTSRTGRFEDLTDEVWQADFDLKVFAAIRLARLAIPGMKNRRWGRIINVLNTGAKTPGPGSAPTTIMRAAGMALTKVLAGEGAPHNVLVNALMTGLIVSDQWVRRYQREAPAQTFEEFLAATAKSQALPMGRFGTAEEFANIACFLASDAASYISGTAINVDGAKSPVV